MTTKTQEALRTLPEYIDLHAPKPNQYIGLLGNDRDSAETRILLTPEICGLLISGGWKMKMESDAASSISYTDEDYASYGVEICSRQEALDADYVLSYPPLGLKDLEHIRPGATLMCYFTEVFFDSAVIDMLLEKRICAISLDHAKSHNGVPIFGHIVAEIDGCAAVWYAQEAFSFLGGGKGVLLGGVAGIPPCEVVAIGCGTRVMSAVKAALAARASVTLLDNDMSELAKAADKCGGELVTCAIHPRPLVTRISTADVIFLDDCTNPFTFPAELKAMVKKDAFVLDFRHSSPSVSTPRTVAMAVGTCMSNLFAEIGLKGGMRNLIATNKGAREAIITYNGHLTGKLVAAITGKEAFDLEMMLESAN